MKPLKIENRLELLKEIRNNNCREILAAEVNIRVAEGSKVRYGQDKWIQIEGFIKAQKQRLEDLTIGVNLIDDEIAKISTK